MSPIKETDHGSGKFTLTAPAWVFLAALSSGTGLLTSYTSTYSLRADPEARPDPYTGTMAERDQSHNERARTKLETKISSRLERIEGKLDMYLRHSAECCGRVSSIERELGRKL